MKRTLGGRQELLENGVSSRERNFNLRCITESAVGTAAAMNQTHSWNNLRFTLLPPFAYLRVYLSSQLRFDLASVTRKQS